MSWFKRLKYKLKYILVLGCFPFLGSAQIDSLSALVFDRLISDVAHLPESGEGKELDVNSTPAEHFSQEYLKLDPKLFPTPLEEASVFYGDLIRLPIQFQQNLAHWFAAYEPMITRKIEENDLPNELKYLAPALSAMNLKAIDPDRNAGMWQLNHFQGILNGLQVGRLVDERFDAEKSTVAALQEIQKNIRIFGSEERAVLAYLAGKVQVRNIIAQLGDGVSTTAIMEELHPKIAARVAAYQAFSVYLQTTSFYNFELPFKYEEVTVERETHFQQFATVLNVPIEKIQALNPQFRFSIIPGDKSYSLKVPVGKKQDFIKFQDSINNAYDSALFEVVAQKIEYPPAPERQYLGEKVKDLEIEGKTKIRYMIKTGDVLGFIAEDFDVRVADLKYWNNIYNERKIQAGQTIDIFVDDDMVEYYTNLNKPSGVASAQSGNKENFTVTVPEYTIPESARKIEHIVKSGESPYVIAQKYKGVTPEAILQWNGISDARKIQIGQKLTIYLTQ